MSSQNLVSGMRSTGRLHLGHYKGVIENWVKLQNEYNCFYFVADWHALTTKFDKTENLKEDKLNVVMDWLACGIDESKSTIYIQSEIPEISQLHILLSMITPNNWAERDPTLKDMIKIIKSGDENSNVQMSYGLLGYPILMSADIMAFNAAYVPVGVDQLAHLEITRDIARRFNNLYKVTLFNEPSPKLTQVPLLKGVDGQKMGKSFHNDIKISDNEETTTKKIMQAVTDRTRLRKTDLGHPDKCEVVFDYYKVFSDSETVNTVCDECQKGLRGCADCKRQLAKIINAQMAPIREKRIKFAENPDLVKQILAEGRAKARPVAKEILQKANDAIGISL